MIGKTLAQYRILSRLGEGGMGVVYLAEDVSLLRNVALKFLPSESVATDDERSRLVREARAAASLLHPNICPIYEIGDADGHAFIAMAHLEGENLEDRLANGPLPPATALAIACQVGEALAAAHAKGIVHRDVKPGNVMLTEGDNAVLMDFGLATMTGASRLTQPGTAMGTMAYMPPEQIQAGDVDQRSDVWALGVMLYEMVKGQRPFRGEYHGALIYAILHGEPAPLETANTDLSAGLDGIIARALAKDPSRRYQRVDDLVADLQVVLKDPSVRPQQRSRTTTGFRVAPRRTWRSGPRFVVFGAAAALLGVAAWIGFDAWRGGGAGVIDSLGVLPLQNLSGDAAQDVWAAGMTAQLSASIGSIASLKVVSDQTMKQFRESDDPLSDIGRQVGASGLVEGSVQVVGDEIQITVKLYDADEDRMIWSNIYRNPLSDIQAVQGRIATDIANHLEAEITPRENQRLAAGPVVDPEAYKAVLIGWNELSKLAAENVRNAVASFRHAIDVDPTYAEAYAGLASAHWWRALLGYGHPDEEFPLVRAAALEALKHDEENAHGHAALGSVLLMYDWDWAGAEREIRRALELNPSSAKTHVDLASCLTAIGRPDAAIEAARRATELDPLNGFWGINLAWNLLYNGREEEAVDLLQSIIRIRPELGDWAYNHLAWSYTRMGMGEAACAAYDSSLVRRDDEPVIVSGASHVFGRFGRTKDARRLAETLEAWGNERYLDPYCLAFAYDGLGDIDSAAAWLERAFAERSPSLWGMRVELWTDEFKSDPRFQAVLERMNYPAP